MKRDSIILLLILLFSSTILFAQDMQWKQYTNGDYTRCSAFDGDCVWVGTQGGLVKYNTITESTEYFNNANSELPHNDVTSIVVSSDGTKWIGTRYGGLASIHNGNWTIYNSSNSGLPSNSIDCLAIDDSDDLWIGSYGLTKFDGVNWTTWNSENSSLSSNMIKSIDFDSLGNIWFALFYRGLVSFDGSTFIEYSAHEIDLPFNCSKGIAIDDNNVVWLAADFHGGLYRFDGTCWTEYQTNNSGIQSDYLRDVTIDSDGIIWLSAASGVIKYNGTSWEHYNTTNSGLPYSNVLDISVADEKLFVCTSFGSVLFDKIANTWVNLNESNSQLDTNRINDIVVDLDGDVWFSSHGITRIEGDTWNQYLEENTGAPIDYNRDIEFDSNGVLWVATSSDGLVSFDGSDWIEFNTSNSDIPTDHMESMEIDNNGTIWCIGHYDKDRVLFNYDGNGFTTYWDLFNYYDRGFNLVIDSDNTVWIEADYELAHFVNNQWIHYTADNSGLRDEYICDIAVNNNLIWITYSDGFISSYDGLNWVDYDLTPYGLTFGSFQIHYFDSNDCIWLSNKNYEHTDSYLAKFSFNDVQYFRTSNSGLSSNKVSAMVADNNETLWFATEGGIAIYGEQAVSLQDDIQAFEQLNFTNYPNPFNPSTNISFTLSKAQKVKLSVYNVRGQLVNLITENSFSKGTHSIEWDGLDKDNRTVSSGVYFFRIESESSIESSKALLLK